MITGTATKFYGTRDNLGHTGSQIFYGVLDQAQPLSSELSIGRR